ncbi:MAG: DUF1320 domain-containing protein [Sulfuricellaceae bacterium]
MPIAYATINDLIARTPRFELEVLTDFDNVPPSEIAVARVQTALDDAQADVDGYVGVVYALPLIGCARLGVGGAVEYVPPPKLTALTCDIARYRLHDQIGPESEPYLRYKAALRGLESIAAGKTQLSCPWGGLPGRALGSDVQAEDVGEVYFDFSPRSVTDEALESYR